jgi:hypothetical protein
MQCILYAYAHIDTTSSLLSLLRAYRSVSSQSRERVKGEHEAAAAVNSELLKARGRIVLRRSIGLVARERHSFKKEKRLPTNTAVRHFQRFKAAGLQRLQP